MSKLVNKIKIPFDSIKETSWSTIFLFSVLYSIYITFINLIVFKSNILQPIPDATLGLIDQTLTVNIASVIIFGCIIILWFGRLSFFDIGFKKNRFLGAAAAIVGVWIFLQLLNIVFGVISSGKPIINGDWNKYGIAIVLGRIIAQFFGNCLYEELAFRGFLLVQICRKFKDKKRSVFTGIVLSQMLFALIHIPNRILGGMSAVEILINLILVFLIGVLFAAVYLATDNIFLSIGIHALWNTPALIFDGIPSALVVLIASITLIIIWDRTFAKLGSKSNPYNQKEASAN